jgi:hypothetical protein
MKASKREKPKSVKRATERESPKPEERATKFEKTSERERAKGVEKTVEPKRASETEESETKERANDAEKPNRIERFSLPIRESIRTLTRSFYDYQRERLALDGRLGRTKAGKAKSGRPDRDVTMLQILDQRREYVFEFEQLLAKDLARIIHQHPLWKSFLSDVKGCGETMAAVIISEFDINIATTVSKLWSFSGLAPGKDRKVKGQKCPFNQFLRAKLCGVLGPSFLKCNSPYRIFYDEMKHRLESKDWGMASKHPTDPLRPKAGHQHKAANRYMVKQFLKDLYVAWRTLEGLPVRKPYEEEYLGKQHSA